VPKPEDIIDLELSSCIQKLAFLRGITPRSFPADEFEVIKDFGLLCRLRALNEVHARRASGGYRFDADGDYERDPLDEDTEPGFKSRRNT
jgi:hypothetical protein